MDNKWVSNYINELTSTNEANDSAKALNTAKTEITEKVTEFKNTKTARILTKRWKGKDMEQYFQDKAATNKANPNRKSDILKIYKGLNKGDLIDIKYDSAIRKGDEYKSFVVSKGKTKVGKQKVERITLQIKDKPKTVKFYLYNRNNNIYFAIGDMGASIVDIKKPTNEVVNEAKEPEVITQLRKIVKDSQNDLIKDTKTGRKIRVDMNSANLMIQVYDALKSQSNKDKFVNGGVVSMGLMAFKLMKKENTSEVIEEGEYQGRTVKLNKPMQGDVKKFKVYVNNEKGNVVKVNFGQKGMVIKKDNPAARKSFRARMNCDNPGPKWKANYWSCRKW